ncbi:UbiA family prenyltransferase [Natrialbaceae archaeon AArc-T1-2]|uniref:UbiA family prenyltransferase n=1 Tax=Natrialbaceae archaeon AArc-T1-2 TaxID=3053904 RepID=UPI00255AB900|nr:UbiA family prenyltransferase [Natrialbaceae archaeon AArc-T1-2]WIV66620.1 UbiA family prenyltransferase [Natrialbaceae archaeon AArc-T1-2]
MTLAATSRDATRQLVAAFKNSPALLGASALANVYVTSVLLSIEPNASWIVVPLVAVSVYVLDDVTDRIGGDDLEVEPRSREAFYSRPVLVAIVAVGGYGVAVAITAVVGDAIAVGLTLVPGVAGVVYSLPWLSIGDAGRVKEVFLLNTAVIAAPTAILGTLLPVALSPDPVPTTATAALVVFWFVRYAVGVETCNVPDLEADERDGVSTLPTRYGVETTRRLLYAGDVVAIIVLLAFVMPESGPLPVALMLPVLGCSMALTYYLTRPRLREPLCVAWDGLHVVMGAVVAIGVTVAAIV